jgi:hypothetical protein
LTYSEQANFGCQEEENLKGAQQNGTEDKKRDDGRSNRAMRSGGNGGAVVVG